jgi:hypothetical protein
MARHAIRFVVLWHHSFHPGCILSPRNISASLNRDQQSHDGRHQDLEMGVDQSLQKSVAPPSSNFVGGRECYISHMLQSLLELHSPLLAPSLC